MEYWIFPIHFNLIRGCFLVGNLDKIFIKNKKFKMDCYWCLNKNFTVMAKKKVGINKDNSICYSIESECDSCHSVETFFINFYNENSISENLIEF